MRVVNLPSTPDLMEPVSWSVLYCLSATFFGLSLCKGPNWVATLNAGKGGAHASYYHRANKQVKQLPLYYINTPFTFSVYWKCQCECVCVDQIQVGVEFEASTRTQETTTSFGYQMELPEANMVFRGKLLSATFSGKAVKGIGYQKKKIQYTYPHVNGK